MVLLCNNGPLTNSWFDYRLAYIFSNYRGWACRVITVGLAWTGGWSISFGCQTCIFGVATYRMRISIECLCRIRRAFRRGISHSELEVPLSSHCSCSRSSSSLPKTCRWIHRRSGYTSRLSTRSRIPAFLGIFCCLLLFDAICSC